jgi:DNA repair ATPase RecN
LIQNQEGVWTNISLNEVINLIKNDLTISVNNVSDLNKWITENRNNVEGLMSSADKNNISTLLNNVEILTTQISDITQDLNNYVSYIEYNNKINEINSNINLLQEAMTWSSID